MKFALRILPKAEVLDTQGRAVKKTLESHGFQLTDCHVGKYLVIETSETHPEKAREQVLAMAKKGLYNPLIETFQLEQL